MSMNFYSKGLKILLLAAIMVPAACEDNVYKGDGDSGLEKKDVFDFSTTQPVMLDLQYDLSTGFRGKFEAYTENPLYMDDYKNYLKKEGISPFMAGYTKTDGSVDFALELPAYVPEVYFYSTTFGVPALLKGKVENGKVKPAASTAVPQVKTRANTKPYYTAWQKVNLNWKSLAGWDENGRPENLLSPGITLGKEDLEIIQATIPSEEKLDPRFCSFDEIVLSEEARVKLYYVSHGASARVNAVAYYVYQGNTPSQAWINENLILLYPNLTEAALQPGDGILLKYYEETDGTFKDRFPAGSRIGFVLLVDAWKGKGEVASKTHVMYSQRRYNGYNIGEEIMRQRPQMALFRTDEKLILSFEDQPWTGLAYSPYQGDFRDNVFVVEADPVTALPDDVPDGNKPDKPAGIPTEFYAKKGILAFEDVWPYKGDYDMNDIVVRYNSSVYCNGEWDITGVVDTFTFLHNGAQYENGFGYQMGIDKSNIKKWEIISTYKCTGQGLDDSFEKATFMLFDNGKVVPAGTEFVVKIWLNTPVTAVLSGYTFAPYNPFITINEFLNPNRKEVHLVNYEPTSKADRTLLGYGHDLSDPEKGIYYVSDAAYPFALDLNGLKEYTVPTETHKINEFYPQFDRWVSSGKKECTDWYLHPVQ